MVRRCEESGVARPHVGFIVEVVQCCLRSGWVILLDRCFGGLAGRQTKQRGFAIPRDGIAQWKRKPFRNSLPFSKDSRSRRTTPICLVVALLGTMSSILRTALLLASSCPLFTSGITESTPRRLDTTAAILQTCEQDATCSDRDALGSCDEFVDCYFDEYQVCVVRKLDLFNDVLTSHGYACAASREHLRGGLRFDRHPTRSRMLPLLANELRGHSSSKKWSHKTCSKRLAMPTACFPACSAAALAA